MTLAERKTLVSFLEIYRLTSGGCSKNQWCKSETFMHFTSNQSLKPSVSPFVAVRTTLQSPIGSQQKTGRVHTKLFYKTAFLSKYHASAMMMMELAEKKVLLFLLFDMFAWSWMNVSIITRAALSSAFPFNEFSGNSAFRSQWEWLKPAEPWLVKHVKPEAAG